MGYLRQWRYNLAKLGAFGILVGLVALALVLAHRRNVADAKTEAKQGFVVFVVTGSAPAGAFITEEEEGTPAAVLAKRARLPFRARLSTADGSSSYGFQAQLLGAGRIRCTVRIGAVVQVKEASGMHAVCTPAVTWYGSRLGGSGWVPS